MISWQVLLTQRMKNANVSLSEWIYDADLFLWMNQIHFSFNLFWFSWMSSVLLSLSSRYAWSNRFHRFTTLHICLLALCLKLMYKWAFRKLKFHSQNKHRFIHRWSKLSDKCRINIMVRAFRKLPIALAGTLCIFGQTSLLVLKQNFHFSNVVYRHDFIDWCSSLTPTWSSFKLNAIVDRFWLISVSSSRQC